jgi:hypothetical protein
MSSRTDVANRCCKVPPIVTAFLQLRTQDHEITHGFQNLAESKLARTFLALIQSKAGRQLGHRLPGDRTEVVAQLAVISRLHLRRRAAMIDPALDAHHKAVGNGIIRARGGRNKSFEQQRGTAGTAVCPFLNATQLMLVLLNCLRDVISLTSIFIEPNKITERYRKVDFVCGAEWVYPQFVFKTRYQDSKFKGV